MRLAAFIFFCVLSTFAGANGLKAAGAETAGQPAIANVSQGGASTNAQALQCNLSIVIENPETAKAVGEKAESDADSFASHLADLPAAAQASVATLAGAHALDPSLLGRAYFSKLCDRLAEKPIAPAELKPALQNLAQALGVTYPGAAQNGASVETAAKEQTDQAPPASPAPAPAASPGTNSGLQIPSMTTDTPQSQPAGQTPADKAAEPSAPLAAPSASATAPAAPQPPSVGTETQTPAPAAASSEAAPEAPAQTAQTPTPSPEAAPAASSEASGSASAPPGTAAPQAAAPEAAPPEPAPAAPVSAETPVAPASPPAQVAEAPASAESAPAPAAAPASAEMPAAPVSPPAQVAEAPASAESAPAPAAAPPSAEQPANSGVAARAGRRNTRSTRAGCRPGGVAGGDRDSGHARSAAAACRKACRA